MLFSEGGKKYEQVMNGSYITELQKKMAAIQSPHCVLHMSIS